MSFLIWSLFAYCSLRPFESKVFSPFSSHSLHRYVDDILIIREHNLGELEIFTLTIDSFMVKYVWTIN